jgi:hypothetical protein
MNIYQDYIRHAIYILQEVYINKILKDIGMSICGIALTPVLTKKFKPIDKTYYIIIKLKS